ncbi:MAG: glycosyltransferase family 2 protein [Thermoanaerobaculia bacterium]
MTIAHASETSASSPVAASALDVSVVIVTWNSAQWIERCLAALPAAAGGLAYEAVVWDNASEDATVERARRRADERTEVVRSPSNRGFAGAVNELLARTRGRLVFLLNPDCAPAPGSIAALAAYLERSDAAGAVPMLVGDDGASQREFQLRRFPTLGSILADVLLFEKIHPSNRASGRYRYRDLDVSVPQPVEQPAAAAILLRRATLERIGPFDERFGPAWFEDVDYCRRIAEAGEEIHLVPDARVVHSGGSSLEVLGIERFLPLWYRNLYLYASKWMRPAEREAVRWGIIGGMLLRIAAASVGLHREKGSRRSEIRAYVRVLGDAWRRWDGTSRSS